MALGKRKRSSSRVPKSRVVSTAMRVGNWASLARASRARTMGTIPRRLTALYRQVRALNRSIETKEGQWTSAGNISLQHNAITLITKGDGGVLNPFQRANAANDPMAGNQLSMVGDEMKVKGMMVKCFLEGALQRSKVYFRIMLVKFARGDTPTTTTLFKGDSPNKMLDVVNTERYTIVWQKIINVSPPNPPPNAVSLTGVAEPGVLAGVTGNRIVKAWIPGYKFGNGGRVQYVDASPTDVKFFDYRFFILAYDWYGTPSSILDVPNYVGKVNSMFSKLYFKDA